MDNLPRLVTMVGLPRSGKSTLVKSWYIPHGYSAVSPDQIRGVLHGDSDIQAGEHFVWAIVYAMADSLLAMGNKVVIDSTAITRRRRDPWRHRGAVFHHIPTPYDICLLRGQGQSNACNIVPVIEKMHLEFEPLNDDEIQWEPPTE